MPETTTDLDALLEGLNEPQREAVKHPGGPLLILAGAGSGKTRVLTHRIAYLLATEGARPDEILAITFTNKAAGEMRDRAGLLVGRRVRAMWVMTFHSACARMLRAHADRLGYTRQFTIYDQADSRRLLKRCLDELGIDPKRFTPAAIGSQISDAKNRLRDAEAYAQMVGSYFEQTVADVYREYERQLHRMNAMDFDDLLVRAVNVLELFQEVRDTYAQGFRHILVDEYQDTNHAQYRWLQLLASEHRNISVVGDPDQSIYQFRGADIRNILEFEDDFVDAHVYLQVLVNPQDAGSFTRIVNSPRRGVGTTSVSRVLSHANTMGVPIWDAASEPEHVSNLGGAAVNALRRFMGTMHVLRERAESKAPVAEVLKDVLRESGYLEWLEAERTIEAQGRIENLEELVNVAAEYDSADAESRSLAEFLEQVSLRSDADERVDDEGLVTLMTLHNAKGLEFGIVFIIGFEEGVFPHSRALDEGGLEEERRLCYVGITRAERELYMTYARTRNVLGARNWGVPSRLVSEIGAGVAGREEQQQPPRGL